MVKDHSNSERGNPLPPLHGLLFPISSHRRKWVKDSRSDIKLHNHFLLVARVLLYAPSHKQDITYHCLCYTSRGALAGIRNSSIDPPWGIDPTTRHTMIRRSTTERHLASHLYQYYHGSLFAVCRCVCEQPPEGWRALLPVPHLHGAHRAHHRRAEHTRPQNLCTRRDQSIFWNIHCKTNTKCELCH